MGRLIMIYIGNVDMAIAFENADEENLLLLILLRLNQWLIRAIARRNNRRNGNVNNDNNNNINNHGARVRGEAGQPSVSP